ncbi:MAG: alpha/beta fold hydrolase [Candidatus Thorarchaeota archaeon]
MFKFLILSNHLKGRCDNRKSMQINYDEMGDPTKKTIIFVHGAGGSAATWFMQLRGLSDDYHVVAIELNGHGGSTDRAEQDIRRSYLEDIHEIVSQFSKPVLGGHSMGGALTQLYALTNPDNLSGIILVGTGAKLRVTPIVFDLLENNFEGYVEAIGNFMFHDDTSTEIIDASRKEVMKCPAEIISRDFKMCDNFDIMESVSKIKLPTLIIVGEGDVMTPIKYATFLHEKIEGSEMHVISSAGHAVMLEQSSIFNKYVKNWIEKLI